MTQYIFFSGKGGVGKTTMAATTAVYEAKQGKRTLLVSTDPAGNLGDIFEKDITTEPLEYAKNLFVAQMDSHAITEAYKDKMLAPLAEILDGLALEQVKEEFNSGCTVEIATFDKFTDFLADQSYDLIVFDTAPTGHTLRLMTLPGEWNQFILKSAQGSGQTCIGPVSQIEGSRVKYEQAVTTLQDQDSTTVYLVSRPEKTSVYETLRAKSELERTGIHNFRLIINGVFPNHGSKTGVFAHLAQNQHKYIAELQQQFNGSAITVPMQAAEIKGLKSISLLGGIAYGQTNEVIETGFKDEQVFANFSSGQQLTTLLGKKAQSRIVVLTGKGGVGKTIAACATAWHLSKKGKTLLLTTDPAAHIGQVLETKVNYEPVNIEGGLWAANIEQKQAVEKNLLSQPGWDYVVLDTAPTGHTLRLLELPFEFKDQMDAKNKKQNTSLIPTAANSKIEGLINRMKNPEETSFLLVAYPEFTPLHESHRAMKDLERVGIDVQGVLLNHILQQDDCPKGFAQQRWKLQQHYLNQAAGLFENKPLFAIPLQSTEINGIEKIKELSEIVFNQ